MKKILSLTLAVLMLVSAVPTAFAAENNWEGGTTVTYTATGTEEWTVTVPATLAPSTAGDVTAAGTWGSNRKLVVTADDDVTLINSINSADQKVLTVTFADIALVGDNTQAVSETKQVSVAAMPADALFGTWSGTFYYNVEMIEETTRPQFTVSINHKSTNNEFRYDEGMTWEDWVNSEYNTDGYTLEFLPFQLEGAFVKCIRTSDGYYVVHTDNDDGNYTYALFNTPIQGADWFTSKFSGGADN